MRGNEMINGYMLVAHIQDFLVLKPIILLKIYKKKIVCIFGIHQTECFC